MTDSPPPPENRRHRSQAEDFTEISHSGGKITFSIRTDQEGNRKYQVGISGNRPVPMSLIAVYALREGIAVEEIELGGIGQPWNPPPFPGCFPVFIASDSEGYFGHHCPSCNGYWRSGPFPNICPYCAIPARSFQFLSAAQSSYVRGYCRVLSEALASEQDGDVVIDMDAVADAVGKEGEKPAFYVSEESQQRKFTCPKCDEFNDILGRFGYCSRCGTRNDQVDFEDETIPAIRKRLNENQAPEDCVRDSVAAFDSFVAQVSKALVQRVPMTVARQKRLSMFSFHKLEEVQSTFKEWFDIDLFSGMKEEERRSVVLMFHHRHVYEHNGGEVDQRYLDNSGDITVRLKQRLRENKEGAHSLLSALVKMTRNLHAGFHELFPPLEGPIKSFEERKDKIAKYSNRK
jgi:hypothetical protein